MSRSQSIRVLVVVPTHTTRHLACCLASLLTQIDPPDAVCLSTDNADPHIAELAQRVWSGTGLPPLILTQRPFRDVASLNQVRNNALRAMDTMIGIRPEDQILILDGDTTLHPGAIGIHRSLAGGITTAYRIDLDQQRTDLLTEERIRQGNLAAIDQWTTQVEMTSLRERHQRHQRQVLLRNTPLLCRLQKPNKPKLLGGHHAVNAGLLRAINGYDEAYIGYGYDDDDLASRLNALRPKPDWSVATADALAFHLWHPTRAPARPTNAPGYALFKQKRPCVAQLGWSSPDEQEQPRIDFIGG